MKVIELKVIEDACQAHGAYLKLGDRSAAAGTLCNAGCLSFYPDKSIDRGLERAAAISFYASSNS